MQKKDEKVLLTRRLHGRVVSKPVYNKADEMVVDVGVRLHEVLIQGLKNKGILEINVYTVPQQIKVSI